MQNAIVSSQPLPASVTIAPNEVDNESSVGQKIASAVLYIFTSIGTAAWGTVGSLAETLLTIPTEIYFYNNPKSRHEYLANKISTTFQKSLQEGNAKVILKPKEHTHLYRERKEHIGMKLDLRCLNRVIEIDPIKMTAHVQGSLTFDDFIQETLKVGLRPCVVPELLKITIGGAFAGLAVESTSHEEGLFHETVKELEVLTATGERVLCSREHNSDLFHMIPNSFGTLGYILSAKVKLKPAKAYVSMEYRKFSDIDQFFKAVEEVCAKKEHEFIDGVIYSENEMVLVVGNGVNQPTQPSCNYVEKIYHESIRHKGSDCLPILDYLSRWNHDSFWSTKGTILENPLVRKTVGPLVLRTDRLNQINKVITGFRKNVIAPFQTETIYKERIIQDIGVPINNCAAFTREYKDKVSMYPLFICPVRPTTKENEYPLWNLKTEGKIICDIGFFGEKESLHSSEERYYNRIIEKFLLDHNAKKSLYSTVNYTEDLFKKLYYGNGAYDHTKQKWDPNHVFPSLYDKCVKGR